MKINKSNNNIKAGVYLSIMVLILINACTVYYKTSDVRKTFSGAIKETNKAIETAEKDMNQKQDAYDQLVSNIPDPSIDPYPRLAATLNEMTSHISMLYELHSQLDSLRNEFESIAKDKKRIESNNPEWKIFKATKAEYESAQKEMQSISRKYSDASNSFISIANNYKIAKVNVPDVRNKVDSYLNDIDASVKDIEKKIIEYREILADVLSRGVSQKKIAKRQELLHQLESIVATVTEKRNEIGLLIKQFKKESGNNTEIWSGPGMAIYTLLSDINKLGDEITQLGRQFNKISKKL